MPQYMCLKKHRKARQLERDTSCCLYEVINMTSQAAGLGQRFVAWLKSPTGPT
jgi:hypothetical protein